MLVCPAPTINGPFTVRAVNSHRDKQRFLDFPYELYRDDRFWIPPLRVFEQQLLSPRHNPFYEHGQLQQFLATDQSGRVVGRIAAIINGTHLKSYNDNTGFFGFYEFVDNSEVAAELLQNACAWLKLNGLNAVRGPASPTMNDLSGLLVDGFDREPYIFMPYNKPYFEASLIQAGFQRAMTMWAYHLHPKFARYEHALPALEAVYRYHPGLSVRSANKSKMSQEVRTIVDIHNESFTDNWGHVPLTDSEFAHLAKIFDRFVDPDLVLFLELDGRAVGFTVCLPNYNEVFRYIRNGKLLPFGWLKLIMRTKFGGIRNVRSVLTAVSPKFRGHGFDAVLCFEGAKRARLKHYEACELSWILDVNKIVINGLESLGAARDKEYAMFEKKLL